MPSARIRNWHGFQDGLIVARILHHQMPTHRDHPARHGPQMQVVNRFDSRQPTRCARARPTARCVGAVASSSTSVLSLTSRQALTRTSPPIRGRSTDRPSPNLNDEHEDARDERAPTETEEIAHHVQVRAPLV